MQAEVLIRVVGGEFCASLDGYRGRQRLYL